MGEAAKWAGAHGSGAAETTVTQARAADSLADVPVGTRDLQSEGAGNLNRNQC